MRLRRICIVGGGVCSFVMVAASLHEGKWIWAMLLITVIRENPCMKISESVITLKGFSFPNLLVLRGPSKLLLSAFKYKQTLFSVYN